MTGLVDLNPVHLAIVEHILAEHVPEYEVRVFGSRAMWNARDTSDLDLAVIGDGPLPSRTLTMLKEAFEESRLPMCVDVIDWHAIADSFREFIEPDCVVVQEAVGSGPWPVIRLGEAVHVNPPRPLKRGTDAPFVAMGDLLEHSRQLPVLSTREFKGGGSRFCNGDTLLARITPSLENGKTAWVSSLPEGAIGHGSTEFIVMSAQDKVTDSKFVYYLARSPDFRRYAISQMTGTSGRQRVPSDVVRDFELVLPPIEKQRAIARVLSVLDDKIELNQCMSETLEEMARALFKSWFVTFDPVRAKAEGRPSGLPPNLDVLFPASFEVSEWGEIPSGWEVKTLGDAFRITMGQSPPGKTYNQDGKGLSFYQGRTDFGFRFPRRRVYCTEPTRFAEKGDSLVSVRAPVGDVNMAMESCCIGRGVAAVRHLSGSCSYTYYSMRSLRDTFQQFEAEGTVFGAIGKRDFLSMRWVSPPNRLIEQFEESCSVMDNLIETNEVATS